MKITADENIPFVEDCFSALGQVQTYPGSEITPEKVADTDILVVRSVTQVNEQLLENSSVKFVGTSTIGVDHIDRDYLAGRGTGFASAPASNADSVAEYMTSALLNIADKKQITLEGTSIGIIGVGNVGSRVAGKAQALGMTPVLNDPPLKRETGDDKYRPLEELYDCDFITLHTPLTRQGRDKTFHLVDSRFLANLKDGAVLLNTSRGAVAETDALKQAVKGGKLSAVCLDVWENEPEIDTELLEMVDIATPHIAGYSFDGKVRGMVMIYNAVCEYFNLEKRASESDFLPEPKNKELQIENCSNIQQAVLEAVNKIYNVCEDDKNLRKILELDGNTMPDFFRKLRKEYPVRREFYNTTVKIKTSSQKHDRVKETLSGLGFNVENQRG